MIDTGLGFGFTIWSEKQPNEGEDSPPLLEQVGGTTLVGVFDGLGGAGGRRYQLKDHDRTGAYLASRTGAITVQKVFSMGSLEPERAAGDAGFLESALESSLHKVAAQFEASESRVKSRMRRELPTTMAIATARGPSVNEPEAGVEIGVWWAGDSRVYVFDPRSGLASLTTDHVVGGGDAMTNLTDDAALSNCLSADQEFHVDAATYSAEVPMALLAATDGCFGYVATPMHFENMLLSSLAQATDADDWAALLKDRITAVAADDAALSLVVIGATFGDFQESCRVRRKELNQTWIVPIENAASDRAAARERLRQVEDAYANTVASSWKDYRAGYEAFVPASEPETDPGEVDGA